MATFEALEIAIPFAIALIFSIIAVAKERSEVYYKFIASVCWLVFTVVYFIYGQANASVTVYALTFLWLGFSLTFMFMGIHEFFYAKKEKRLSFDEW